MTWKKLLLLAIVTVAAVAVLCLWVPHWSLDAIAQHEQELRHYSREHPLLTGIAAFGLYYLLTSLAIPGTWTLSVVYGWLFGFWTATIEISLAATAGATTSMLLGRYLFRDLATAHFGHRLQAAEAELDRHGAQYVVMLRFLWMIPAFVVNVVMALTKIPVWTFWWATQIGLLPGICLHTLAGAQLKPLRQIAEEGLWGLFTPPMLAAFVALAVFPVAIKALSVWYQRRKAL